MVTGCALRLESRVATAASEAGTLTVSRTAASLLREALENVGVRYTFGIPGVHNTEIYDELAKSPSITPVLVTHECGGAFMADAICMGAESFT